jgi:hypothetical protein
MAHKRPGRHARRQRDDGLPFKKFFVASNFVLQLRRWMTASYIKPRWLPRSMHNRPALKANNINRVGDVDAADATVLYDAGEALDCAAVPKTDLEHPIER